MPAGDAVLRRDCSHGWAATWQGRNMAGPQYPPKMRNNRLAPAGDAVLRGGVPPQPLRQRRPRRKVRPHTPSKSISRKALNRPQSPHTPSNSSRMVRSLATPPLIKPPSASPSHHPHGPAHCPASPPRVLESHCPARPPPRTGVTLSCQAPPAYWSRIVLPGPPAYWSHPSSCYACPPVVTSTTGGRSQPAVSKYMLAPHSTQAPLFRQQSGPCLPPTARKPPPWSDVSRTCARSFARAFGWGTCVRACLLACLCVCAYVCVCVCVFV